jgi:hypothetical protein
VFYANVWPVPDWPLNIIPFLFLAPVVVAIGWYLYLARTRPEAIAAIGTSETDLLSGI